MSEPFRLFCPWDFPGKNTRVGCHSLLQGDEHLLLLFLLSWFGEPFHWEQLLLWALQDSKDSVTTYPRSPRRARGDTCGTAIAKWQGKRTRKQHRIRSLEGLWAGRQHKSGGNQIKVVMILPPIWTCCLALGCSYLSSTFSSSTMSSSVSNWRLIVLFIFLF